MSGGLVQLGVSGATIGIEAATSGGTSLIASIPIGAIIQGVQTILDSTIPAILDSYFSYVPSSGPPARNGAKDILEVLQMLPVQWPS